MKINFESNVGDPTLKLDPMLVAQPKDPDENIFVSQLVLSPMLVAQL